MSVSSVWLSLHLLTDQEVEQVDTFLERLRATYGGEPLSQETIYLLREPDKTHLELWALLLRALEQRNERAASRYRRALATYAESEQVYERTTADRQAH